MIYVFFTEMFEHMKNYEKLLAKVAKWLQPGGKLFVHIFTHKQFAYHFNKGTFVWFLLFIQNWQHWLISLSRLVGQNVFHRRYYAFPWFINIFPRRFELGEKMGGERKTLFQNSRGLASRIWQAHWWTVAYFGKDLR